MKGRKAAPLPDDLAAQLGLGCGDHGCVTGIAKGGQHTNGGCRCLRALNNAGLMLLAQRCIRMLREHLPEPAQSDHVAPGEAPGA